jgi:cyclophilin family peptidyl-prolyl cis-trans isomerase
MRRSTALLALGAALGLSACGSSHAKTSTGAGTPTTPAASAGGCQSVPAPAARAAQHLRKPKLRLNPARTYTVRMVTNCGEIDIQLDVKQAPKTSGSFAYLVRHGFYTGLTFHRISPGFVIQGGDPLGNGSGGPGYLVVEKPPANLRYTRGVVAMAKTQTEPAGTSGSQFFIVTAAQAPLTPDYALAGHVVAGEPVVSRIAALPTGGASGEQPQQPVVMEKVTLQQK